MQYRVPHFVTAFCIPIFIFNLLACKKTETQRPSNNLPVVITKNVSAIGEASAVCGGSVSSSSQDSVISRGLCYSLVNNPTTGNQTILGGTGNGGFDCQINGLIANTVYYVKAFATNSAGTAYGNEQTFTTLVHDTAKMVVSGDLDSVYAFNAGNGKLLWSSLIGSQVLYIAYANNKIFVTSASAKLFCFDMSGFQLWAINTNGQGDNVGVKNNNLYVSTPQGLYVYEQATGVLKWQFSDFIDKAAIAFNDNTIFLNTRSSSVHAFDSETGSLKWRVLNNSIGGTNIKAVNNKLYFFQNSSLLVLDANNGNLLWSKDNITLDNPPPFVNIVNGSMYYNNGNSLYNPSIVARDTINGGLKWRVYNDELFSTGPTGNHYPFVQNNIVFIATGRSYIYQYSAADGTFLNSFGISGNSMYGDITVFDNIVYAAYTTNSSSVPGALIAYTSLGRYKWAANRFRNFIASPCVVTANGRMCRVGDFY